MNSISLIKTIKNVIITLMIIFPAVIIAYFLEGYEAAANIIFLCGSAAVTVLFFAGLISAAVVGIKKRRVSIRKVRTQTWEYTERCDRSIENEENKIKGIIFFDRLWFALTCVSFLVLMAGAFINYNSVGVFAALGLFSLVSFEREGRVKTDEPGLYIDNENYPELNKMIRDTVKEIIPNANIKAFAVLGPAVGLMPYESGYALCLGVAACGLLSRNQLRAAIIHELYHVKKGDVEFTHAVLNINAKYNRGLKFIGGFGFCMMGVPFAVAANRIRMFMTASSRAIEQRIDETYSANATESERRDYVGAMATLRMFEVFLNEDPDGLFLFDSPEPPCNFESNIEDMFRKQLPKRENFWRELLEKELYAKNAPYPNFSKRRETLKIDKDDYSVLPDSDDDNYSYLKDLEGLRSESDQIIFQNMSRTYNDDRQNYLNRLAVYREYLEKAENGESISLAAWFDAAFAAESINQTDIAIKMYDDIIAKYPNNANALFRRGLLYLHEYDERGIDLIYHAINGNGNYINNGMAAIGDFCIKMGLDERLCEFREKSMELLEYEENQFSHLNVIEEKDKLYPVDLPEELVYEITEYIKNTCGDLLEAIYMVKKCVGDASSTMIFITPVKGVDFGEWEKAYHDIFLFLDVKEEQYSLDPFTGTPKYIAKVKKVPSSLVYSKSSEKSEGNESGNAKPQ